MKKEIDEIPGIDDKEDEVPGIDEEEDEIPEMDEEKGEIPEMFVSGQKGAEIKVAVDAYLGIQKARIMAKNRINMFVDRFKLEEDEAKDWHAKVDEVLLAQEKVLKKEFHNKIEDFKIFGRLMAVRGVAETLAAQLIAIVQKPERFGNPSKLHQYGGLGMDKETGLIQKRVKGKKLNYNIKLKVLCWKLADSWNKHHTGYYGQWLHRFWEEEKEKNKPFEIEAKKSVGYLVAEKGAGIEFDKKVLKKNLPKLKKDKVLVIRCKGHVFNRAKRKVAKLFLSQFWATWMQLEGLEARKPYVEEKLGHKIDQFLPFETKSKNEEEEKLGKMG